MSSKKASGGGEAQRMFNDILDIIESLEHENLGNLLRIEAMEEKLRELRNEKIILAREAERLAHRLASAEETEFVRRTGKLIEEETA